MNHVGDGQLLWTPTAARIERSHITRYMRWLAARGLKLDSYPSLWQWSVDRPCEFWQSIWDFFEIRSSQRPGPALAESEMPGAVWFPEARLNYAEHILRHERADTEALVYLSERRALTSMSWEALATGVRKLSRRLRGLGVKPGDRIVAYLPNGPEAIIAMLATASVGAIWASCGPDFGPKGTLDRFTQLAPKLAFCVDGYYYGGKAFDRRAELSKILDELPTLEHVIYVRQLDPDDESPLSAVSAISWADAITGPNIAREDFTCEQMRFSDPLWILFSSGTTGLPKPIVHSHGGILIEHLKTLAFHMDVHPRERTFYFTTTGWMMWNILASTLLMDAVPVLYDGNPTYPDPGFLWGIVERAGVGFFGAGPSYASLLQRVGFVPKDHFRLTALNSVMLAGSPVTAECMAWFYRCVKSEAWTHSGSGGTDLCSGIVGGVVTLPVYAGEIQARQLGVAAAAFNDQGQAVVDEVGELVITQPLPSMPVGFWNDKEGIRYRESYFEFFPGIWRHGDFFRINGRGGCFVLGRSDATLNRHGVRIGTAEVYRALLAVTEIEDSLIVNLDLAQGGFFMPLFIKLQPGKELDAALEQQIRHCMRKTYSARHVPDKIYAIDAIPYTLTGKKMEVPVRRILMGLPAQLAANRDAMANPSALEFFIRYAAEQRDYQRIQTKYGDRLTS